MKQNTITRNKIAASCRKFEQILTRAGSVIICLLLLGCATAQVTSQREIGAAPKARPTVIYVTDFELGAQKIQSDKGALPAPPSLPGPLGKVLPPPPGTAKDPAVRARELVELMSTSLVQGLTRTGLNTRRLRAGEPMPSEGWLVRGLFAEVDEGNRLQRATIGFGQGKTDLQLVVSIDDLSQGDPKPFYELNTNADSGKGPGGIGPYGAAAKFVMAGRDLEKNVKQTASKVATDIAVRVQR